jgi:flagellar biosynthesis/type III secretory pathway protein FliH
MVEMNARQLPRENSNDAETLIGRARAAHQRTSDAPSEALHAALDAGDALIALRRTAKHGQWAAIVIRTGIPGRTERMYRRLAWNRERILDAGCQSIRQALDLLAEKTAEQREAEHARRADADRMRREQLQAAYDRGYKKGYEQGRHDEALDGFFGRSTTNGNALPKEISLRDLRWAIKHLHPDRHNGAVTATRLTQWLNDLVATERASSKP